MLPVMALLGALPFLGGGLCAPDPDPLPPAATRCEPEFALDGGAGPPPMFELGAPDGSGAFQPWSDGATVNLIPGFQGGQMIGIYVRMGDRRAQCVQVHVDVAVQPLHGEDLAHPDGAWAAPAA